MFPACGGGAKAPGVEKLHTGIISKILTKILILSILASLIILHTGIAAFAGGMFGPPQTLSKKEGGLNTAIGYQHIEDVFKSSSDYVLRQHQIYSHAAYGKAGIWEVYGRIGISDLKISDAFSSTSVLTTTSKNNFEENWKFFGTLGAKAFYPATSWFGVGAFVQGTYHFSNYTDDVTGVDNGTPFEADLKIKNLWDVHGGIGFQATLPCSIKLYGGPYLYYSDADTVLSADTQGHAFGTEKGLLQNKSKAGGFFGADIPLARGFRINIEGRYSERLSVGSAITYTY